MKIIANLPKTGLANKLLIWSRAIVFAHKNNFPTDEIIIYPWIDLHFRGMFRKDKRFYWGYFNSSDILGRIKALFAYTNMTVNPDLGKFIKYDGNIWFKKIGQFDLDYFKDLIGYETLIKNELFKLINKSILDKVEAEKSYDIAIHVRRGDFNKELLTDVENFVEIINCIRNEFLSDPLIYIFTDGSENDVSEILKIPNTTLVKNNSAIYDLILMSKAEKVIIPSIRSTYSYFACFLSSANIIRFSNDFCGRIRHPNESTEIYLNKDLENKKLVFPDNFIKNYIK